MVGIQPAATEPVASVLTVDNYSKEGSSRYMAMFYNYNADSYTGKISWAILGEGESFTLLENVQPTPVTRVTSYTYSTLDVSQLNLAEGEYKIVPVCQTNNETEWNLCQGYKQKYVEVKVGADGEQTVVAHPVVDLNVDGLVYQRVTGEYIEMVLDISNHGDDTFGSLHIKAVNTTADEKMEKTLLKTAKKAGLKNAYIVSLPEGCSLMRLYRIDTKTGQRTLMRTDNMVESKQAQLKALVAVSAKEKVVNMANSTQNSVIAPRAFIVAESKIAKPVLRAAPIPAVTYPLNR